MTNHRVFYAANEEQALLRKEFLAALRSGEYEQAEGFLRTPDGYCCLGVATEVYRKTTGNGRWDSRGDGVDRCSVFEGHSGSRSMSWPPDEVCSAYGFESPDPAIDGATASVHNDARGLTFEEIADLFEAEYPPRMKGAA